MACKIWRSCGAVVSKAATSQKFKIAIETAFSVDDPVIVDVKNWFQ